MKSILIEAGGRGLGRTFNTEGNSMGQAQHLTRTEFLKEKYNIFDRLEDLWPLG